MFDALFSADVLKILGPIGLVCLIIIAFMFKIIFVIFKSYREDVKKMEIKYEKLVEENREKFSEIYADMAGVVNRNTAETTRSITTLEMIRLDRSR